MFTSCHSPKQKSPAPETFRDTWIQSFYLTDEETGWGAEASLSFAQGHMVGVRDRNRIVFS